MAAARRKNRKKGKRAEASTNSRETVAAGGRFGGRVRAVVAAVGVAVIGAVAGAVFTTDLVANVGDRVGGGPHLVYSATRQFPASAADNVWAMPHDVPASRAQEMPPAGPDFHHWAVSHGGAQVRQYVTRIQLTNPRFQQVRVVAVRAKVVSSLPAWNGTLFCPYSQGDGDIAEIEINLGDLDPVARVPNRELPGTGMPYFLVNGDITLAQDETVSLVVTALAASGQATRWFLEVTYTVGGEESTLAIDDDGEQFLVTADSEQYDGYFVHGGKEYVDYDWELPGGRYEKHPGGCS